MTKVCKNTEEEAGAMKVTPETLTDQQLRDAMSLGDTPLTGNGFVRACKLIAGDRGLSEFIPCSMKMLNDAELRVCNVINARRATNNQVPKVSSPKNVKSLPPPIESLLPPGIRWPSARAEPVPVESLLPPPTGGPVQELVEHFQKLTPTQQHEVLERLLGL